MFRMITRRFLSLLKPNVLVNLLKDLEGVKDHVQANHVWGLPVKYLENDFSKYDKSQSEFAFGLEAYAFQRLGLNQAMLDKWSKGHIHCKIRVIALGISLDVMYQRKSGDATTALGNVILNVLSVTYAYRGTTVVWAVYMGDDSLVCAKKIVGEEKAVQVMSEIFNLQAKFFITEAPYFASTFFLLNEYERRVTLIPDPIKRIEKFSMAISADEPMFEERYESAKTTLAVYKNKLNTTGLERALVSRYDITNNEVRVGAVVDALATAIHSFDNFRAMWQSIPVRIDY